MMFVCLEHHDQLSNGLISSDDQRVAKAKPFNSKNQLTDGQLINRHDYVAVDLGAHVLMIGDAAIGLRVDNERVIGFSRNEFGKLDVDLELRDKNDRVIATIFENEWICDTRDVWDLRVAWHKLIINNVKNHIVLEIDTKAEPVRLRGQFWWKKARFEFRDSSCTIWRPDEPDRPVNRFSGFGIADADLNLSLSDHTFEFVPRNQPAAMFAIAGSMADSLKRGADMLRSCRASRTRGMVSGAGA